MHEYSQKNKTKKKTFFFQTEVSHPDKAGSMICFGDVEVARINLGAGLMASSRPWLCLSYELLEFIDFLFWKKVYLACGIKNNKNAALLLQSLNELKNLWSYQNCKKDLIGLYDHLYC